MTNHYDPNQPRVHVGHHGGGQWTGGGSGLLDAILGPRGGDGRAGPVQLAFLDPQKPSPPIQLPWPKPAPWTPLKPRTFIPFVPSPHIRAALALYSLLSGLNDDEQQAVIAFRSRDFRRNGPESFDLEGVQILTWEEARKFCGDNFEEVQQLTDKAFEKAKKDGKSLSRSQLGTEIHKLVEKEITSKGDKDFTAEISFAKGDGEARRSAKDTVRLDVFNRVNDKTICIDDIKTGQSGLSYDRMRELAASVSQKEKNVKRIIVTEVRPKGMRPPKPRPPTLQRD